MPRVRRDRKDADDGAAAVEFALVAPILFLVMFAIVDYGIWFSNSLAIRQGVREGARQAVVCNWPDTDSNPVEVCDNNNLTYVANYVRDRVDLIAGQTWVKVAPLDADGDETSDWQRGNSLLVCVVSRTDGLTGFIPLPVGGYQESSVVMRIERPLPKTLGDQELTRTQTPVIETLPAGQSWDFCHV